MIISAGKQMKGKDVTYGTAADRHVRSNFSAPSLKSFDFDLSTNIISYILNSNVDIANPKSSLLFYHQSLKFIERKR